MTSTRINPETLYPSVQYGFSHATLDEATGTVHLSGQVAWDKEYNVVGGSDVGLQARQALANIKAVLHAVGVGPEAVLRLRTFIVDYDVSMLGAIGPELAAFYGDAMPASNTVVGVQALAMPDFLIEIEAIATVK
ncbi:RidA family protein [Sphingomonas sanxanigenens]|uniref:Translational inhibitor protein n=1 Tax=Sphingomonas sanxanigenens DSM 19645 = NX02 TaxID=1123269 RepID=W0AI25_9SPHN|nr:RidA family protein [Sphingomonas sanxanigenens]AHE55310.1 translational inhibitor protein [Sphingomonas sanxanigenens DSM 19645 = NX02]